MPFPGGCLLSGLTSAALAAPSLRLTPLWLPTSALPVLAVSSLLICLSLSALSLCFLFLPWP